MGLASARPNYPVCVTRIVAVGVFMANLNDMYVKLDAMLHSALHCVTTASIRVEINAMLG